MIGLLAQADPDTIRRTAEEVLSQADYAEAGGPSLLDRALQAALEQLGRLLLRFDGDGGAGSIVAALALVAIVLALLTAVVVFLGRLRRGATVSTVVTGPIGRTPVSWADEAERHLREGAYREALRCRYRETLAVLAAADLVDEVPGRTTGEYLHAVTTALPAAADPFATLTGRFEDVWYGGDDVDVDDLAAVHALQARIVDAVPRRTVGAGR